MPPKKGKKRGAGKTDKAPPAKRRKEEAKEDPRLTQLKDTATRLRIHSVEMT